MLPSGSAGKKEKHLHPLPSRLGVTDRHGADGVAIGGTHSHTVTFMHTHKSIER